MQLDARAARSVRKSQPMGGLVNADGVHSRRQFLRFSSLRLFALTAGPDGNKLYTARRQKLTDFKTYEDESETDYKIMFHNIDIAGEWPSAEVEGPVNGLSVWATDTKFLDVDSNSEPVWCALVPPGPWSIQLLEAPDPEDICD